MANLNKSMRANYEQFGVESYYKIVGGKTNSYRNPHFPAVKTCLWVWLNFWWKNGSLPDVTAHDSPVCLRILDLAAGSGEATVAVKEWWSKGLDNNSPADKPSDASESSPSAVIHEVAPATASFARGPLLNPRAPFVPPGVINRNQLRCEASIPRNAELLISATDPYTAEAYQERTGLPCRSLSFLDVSIGKLTKDERDDNDHSSMGPEESGEPQIVYDMVICSFALHLVESSSELWALLTTLSRCAKWLIVVEPHKKPEIKSGWGWDLWDCEAWTAADPSDVVPKEILRERVHCRIFRSSETFEDDATDM